MDALRARTVGAREGVGSSGSGIESESMELMLKWGSGSESESGTLDNITKTLMKPKARSRGFMVKYMLRLSHDC